MYVFFFQKIKIILSRGVDNSYIFDYYRFSFTNNIDIFIYYGNVYT